MVRRMDRYFLADGLSDGTRSMEFGTCGSLIAWWVVDSMFVVFLDARGLPRHLGSSSMFVGFLDALVEDTNPGRTGGGKTTRQPTAILSQLS